MKKRAAHFKVEGGPFGRPRDREATLTIVQTKDGPMAIVRPKRSRRTYDKSLDRVVKWIVESVVKGEVLKKRADKARERKERRKLTRY